MLSKYMFYVEGEFPLSKVIQRICELSQLNLQCNAGMDSDIVGAPWATRNPVCYQIKQAKYFHYGFYFVGFQAKLYVKLSYEDNKLFVHQGPGRTYLTFLFCDVLLELGLKQEEKYYEYLQELKKLNAEKELTLEEEDDFTEYFFTKVYPNKNGLVTYYLPFEWGKDKWDSERIPEMYRLVPMKKMPTIRNYLPFGGRYEMK